MSDRAFWAVVVAWLIYTFLVLAFWAVVIYVAVHFILKAW